MSQSARVYRALLRTYPRQFRDEYARDMTQLLVDQLRDEPVTRVWVRAIVDLAITLPTRHMEAHMKNKPDTSVTALYAAIAIAGVLVAMIAGSVFGVAAIALIVAVIAGGLATASWRNTRTITQRHPLSDHWLPILFAGSAVLTGTIIVLNQTGELSERWWAPAMLALLGGGISSALGLVLGLTRFARRP